MDSDLVEFVAYGVLSVVALENHLWWLWFGRQESRPRIYWPLLALSGCVLLLSVVLTLVAGLAEWWPAALGETRSVVRPLLAVATFVALVATYRWRLTGDV